MFLLLRDDVFVFVDIFLRYCAYVQSNLNYLITERTCNVIKINMLCTKVDLDSDGSLWF